MAEAKRATAKRHYDEIDILRGVAIFLMLIGHAIARENIPEYRFPIPLIFDGIYTFHMPLFFFISGVCFSYRDNNYGSYIIKKARRLIVPYLCFNLLSFILRRLLPQFALFSQTPGEMIVGVLFNGGEIWFLYVLFLCFLVQPLVRKYLDTPSKVAVGIAVLWGLYILLPETEWLCATLFLYQYPFFMIGALCRERYLRMISTEGKNLRSWIAIAVLVLLDIVIGRINAGIGLPPVNRLFKVIQAVLGTGAAIFAAHLIRVEWLKAIFKSWGQNSLELYLFNGYFVSVSRTICGMLHAPTPVTIAVNALFLLVFNYIWVILVTKIKPVRVICGRVS